MKLQKTLFLLGLFFLIYLLESIWPLFRGRKQRLRNGFRNLALFAVNTVFLAFFASAVTAPVLWFTEQNNLGIFNLLPLPEFIHVPVVILVFDLWMYTWHRLAHIVPLIWRFHRMHHTDARMDVTTAVRFHLGEILFSSIIRLPIILMIGMRFWELALYEFLMMPVILFHHSNFYLPEKVDRILRAVIVTPWVHWVHHSDLQPETNSNFGTIFPWWDRLAKTFRLREDPRQINYGLVEFKGEQWQTLPGMLKTPLVKI